MGNQVAGLPEGTFSGSIDFHVRLPCGFGRLPVFWFEEHGVDREVHTTAGREASGRFPFRCRLGFRLSGLLWNSGPESVLR